MHHALTIHPRDIRRHLSAATAVALVAAIPVAAVDAALNTDNVRTGDLGGKASTKDFTAAIIKRLA